MERTRTNVATIADLLPDRVMAQLHDAGKTRAYASGELIQQRGDDRRGFSILLSGRVVAGNVGADGSFVVTSVLQAGECYGEFTLFADLPRTHSLSAASDAVILHLTEEKFWIVFAKEPSLARVLLSITLKRTHDLLEFLDDQRRLALPVRLAKLLLSFLDASPSGQTIVCRQEELAFMLGVTRVSVGSALKKLVGQGFLKLGYGSIEIVGSQQLVDWVEARSEIAPVGYKLGTS